MNYKHLIFLSLCTSFFTHTMHIKDLSTKISFDDKELSMFEWLRDYSNHDFGKIPVYTYRPEQKTDIIYVTPLSTITEKKTTSPKTDIIVGEFEEACAIKKINDRTLENIALGQSSYHANIFPSGYKNRGQVIVYYTKKNPDMNELFIKEIDNKLKLHILKKLHAQNKNQNVD